jgi:hypothetical protein
MALDHKRKFIVALAGDILVTLGMLLDKVDGTIGAGAIVTISTAYIGIEVVKKIKTKGA